MLYVYVKHEGSSAMTDDLLKINDILRKKKQEDLVITVRHTDI